MCSKVFESVSLPNPQSAIHVYNYIHVKTLFEINRWDDKQVLDNKLRIKVVFETLEGSVVDATEYIGYVVAFVEVCI